ncbi:MAG: UDP-N-acetylmuramyl tripeptide synthase [Actinomycetia bacterium]|nr:UDP-N-acetylmuramyl tripeptide synthase [Actinomycetes bacterium]
MRVRTRLAVGAGTIAGHASRLAGRGAGDQISGRVMLGVDPELIAKLARDQRVVLVSATNGKTTTTRLIAAALEAEGEPVVSNVTGANLTSGVVSALARARGPGFAVLEVDERVLPRVYDALRPELLVLGNLSRDQLDRFGEVHVLSDRWRALLAANPEQVVVANASDPPVVWAAAPARTTWLELGTGWTGDSATCPQCGALLGWNDRGFACPNCGFCTPETAHRLVGNHLELDGATIPLRIALPGRWNVDNAALAIVAATRLGVRADDAALAVAAVESVAGRMATYTVPDGRTVRVLLAKNPAGWLEVLRYVQDVDTAVVLAVNAHVADGKDPSWLWDVPYELLAGHAVAAAGERALDVAVRLRYAGIDCLVERDVMRAVARIDGPSVTVIASYTQFYGLSRRLARASRAARPASEPERPA